MYNKLFRAHKNEAQKAATAAEDSLLTNDSSRNVELFLHISSWCQFSVSPVFHYVTISFHGSIINFIFAIILQSAVLLLARPDQPRAGNESLAGVKQQFLNVIIFVSCWPPPRPQYRSEHKLLFVVFWCLISLENIKQKLAGIALKNSISSYCCFLLCAREEEKLQKEKNPSKKQQHSIHFS